MSCSNLVIPYRSSLKAFFPTTLIGAQRTLKRKISVQSTEERPSKRFVRCKTTFASLPIELIETIIKNVDSFNDLASLALLNRAFNDATNPIIAIKAGFLVPRSSPSGTSTVTVKGHSYRGLAAWRRSRLFSRVADTFLACDLSDESLAVSRSQIRALKRFLSSSVDASAFNAIYVSFADPITALDILQLIKLADQCCCTHLSFSTGIAKPEWSCSITTALDKVPNLRLKHLRHLQIDHAYLSATHWASLLSHLEESKLSSIEFRGTFDMKSLVSFLSRHSQIVQVRCGPVIGFIRKNVRFTEIPSKVDMISLNQLRGPPSYIKAILQSLSRPPKNMHIVIGSDYALQYNIFVEKTLRALALVGGPIQLELHLFQYKEWALSASETEAYQAIHMPHIQSLIVTFRSADENHLLESGRQWLSFFPSLHSLRFCLTQTRPIRWGCMTRKILVWDDGGKKIA